MSGVNDSAGRPPRRPASGEGQALLAVEGLNVEFATDAGTVKAVRGVSLTLQADQILGVVGESGSGKSVTALAILGLLPQAARVRGSVRYRGTELLGMSENQLERVRGLEIAMVFQDPTTCLDPVYTVGWQVAEALQAHQKLHKKEAMARAVDLLQLVGIPNARQRALSYPHEFSGGMRQRAMIAMAMANDADVIIADEPTTALDVTIQAQVLETLRKAQEETHAGIILITHDLGVVAGMADDVLVMYAGKVVEQGTVDDVFYRPRVPYTLGLLGSLPRVDAPGQGLTPISGSPPSLIDLPPGCPFSPRCPMSRATCFEMEPHLRPIEGRQHQTACHFAEELSAETRADAVFEVSVADGDIGTGRPSMPA